MPVGDSNQLENLQKEVVGLTMLGMVFLLVEIYRKSGEKVMKISNF